MTPSSSPIVPDRTGAVSVFSLAGLGRWLRACDERIAEQGKRVTRDVLQARANIVAELEARGVVL